MFPELAPHQEDLLASLIRSEEDRLEIATELLAMQVLNVPSIFPERSLNVHCNVP
jgi:hypothetical protein